MKTIEELYTLLRNRYYGASVTANIGSVVIDLEDDLLTISCGDSVWFHDGLTTGWSGDEGEYLDGLRVVMSSWDDVVNQMDMDYKMFTV